MKGKNRIQVYSCNTDDLDVDGLPPLVDYLNVEIPSSAICEVRNETTHEIVSVFSLEDGIWCEYH